MIVAATLSSLTWLSIATSILSGDGVGVWGDAALGIILIGLAGSIIVAARVSGGPWWTLLGVGGVAIVALVAALGDSSRDSFRADSVVFVIAAAVAMRPEGWVAVAVRMPLTAALCGVAMLQSVDRALLTPAMALLLFPVLTLGDTVAARLRRSRRTQIVG